MKKKDLIPIVISIIALIFSILSCIVSIYMANETKINYRFSMRPNLVLEKTLDSVIVKNEGKGVAIIEKIYFKKNSSSKIFCHNKKDADNMLRDQYNYTILDKNEALGNGKKIILIHCNNCEEESLFHYELEYFIKYKDYYGDIFFVGDSRVFEKNIDCQ